MREKRLRILINAPVSEVFAFTTDPINTPKWIDGIIQEETNESPAKLGTIYRNQDANGVWRDYVMTEFVKDASFTLTNSADGYHVRYIFRPTVDGGCDFTYHEWVERGELEAPFLQEALETLKRLLEREVIS